MWLGLEQSAAFSSHHVSDVNSDIRYGQNALLCQTSISLSSGCLIEVV
jgi:hypothetical protein